MNSIDFLCILISTEAHEYCRSCTRCSWLDGACAVLPPRDSGGFAASESARAKSKCRLEKLWHEWTAQ